MSSSPILSDQILSVLQEAIGPPPMALHAPTFNGNEWAYVKECLDSTFVSSVGCYVGQFEQELVRFTKAKYAVAVVNGTAALHIALVLADVKAGDEVLMPALTFVATANAIVYCNAIPHFVESDERTLNVDVVRLREYLIRETRQHANQCVNRQTGRVIRAIVPVHTFGHPVDVEELLSIAQDFNIKLIEDAAEAIGSYYKGKHAGTFGLLGTLSFNGNKTITTGGGGAILTNDPSLASRARHLTTTAKLSHVWDYRHDEVGYNYRMPNINAAIGCAQLEQLPGKLVAKRQLFDIYNAAFRKVSGVQLVAEPPHSISNYWLQTLLLQPEMRDQRDQVLVATNKAGYGTRPIWTLMSELPMFLSSPKMDLSVANSLSQRIINIPSSPSLVISEP